MTNATKAVIVTALNSIFAFTAAFGIYTFNEAQSAAVIGLLNVAGLIAIVATYKKSPKRIPDNGAALTFDPNQE